MAMIPIEIIFTAHFIWFLVQECHFNCDSCCFCFLETLQEGLEGFLSPECKSKRHFCLFGIRKKSQI